MKISSIVSPVCLACILLAAGPRGVRSAEQNGDWAGGVFGPRMPLPYDLSAYERWPGLRAALDKAWTLEEAKAVLAQRAAAEKRRRELHVVLTRSQQDVRENRQRAA